VDDFLDNIFVVQHICCATRMFPKREAAVGKLKFRKDDWEAPAAQMLERLGRLFATREQPVARALLKAVSRSDSGLTRDQIEVIAAEALPGDDPLSEEDLLFVVDVLKHDAYLRQDVDGDQKTRFFSAVLRDYWIRKYA